MSQLEILVCIKQVPDPEGPIDAYKFDQETKEVIPVGIAPFLNPFDENALEAALRIKDSHPAKVTVVSMGDKLAQPVLRRALMAGADDLILLVDPQFKDLDSYSTAHVLARAVEKTGPYDLILTGRQSSDWGFGLTGVFMAEMLGMPGVNLARKVEIRNSRVVVEKVSNDGYEVVETSMPSLVTVSNEVGELRYNSSVVVARAASKQPIKILNGTELQAEEQQMTKRCISDISLFHSQRQCQFIDGNLPQEKGQNLVAALKRDGVI